MNAWTDEMTGFHFAGGDLTCDQVPLARLAAEFGTPLYVYSANVMRDRYQRMAAAFAPLNPLIFYACKANANLGVLQTLLAEGAGLDIASGGELYRGLRAGADPARIVFTGVGKTEAEMDQALAAGVAWFNVESGDELGRLNVLAAARGLRARVALRLNPDVAPDTHQHISTGGQASKFGLPLAEARRLAERAADFAAIDLRGAHIHIGSQVPDSAPTLRALEAALDFIDHTPGFDTLDLGGGFPVAYRDTDDFVSIEQFAAPIVKRLLPFVGRLTFHLEPGRSLVADAGALVTSVQAVKQVAGRRTLVVDAGMNTLMRPALYNAYHRVVPLRQAEQGAALVTDVVGPICESADVLARQRLLPPLAAGQALAFLQAGAYGFSMASQYNAQPRPAEVLVDGAAARLVRRRETYADLVQLEEDL